MTPFPSPVELTVASALLLLSTTEPYSASPSLSTPKLGFDGEAVRKDSKSKSASRSNEECLSLASSTSKPCSSSLTTDGSSKEIREHKLRIAAVVACCPEMKLKVVRKKRSKVCCTSSHKKSMPSLSTTSTASTSTEASCLSNTSSAASSVQSCSRGEKRGEAKTRGKLKNKQVVSSSSSLCSSNLRRRAEAILKMLSRGCFSEVWIRQMLGDSPDTSKALRMLLRKEKIRRSGIGGRLDPYIYMIA